MIIGVPGGSQCIITQTGLTHPIDICNGLAYVSIQPFTDQEWEDLEHVTWTLKQAWDPSVMDNKLSTDTDWSRSNLSVERTTLGLASTEPKITDPNIDDQARLLLYISTGGILDCNWNGPVAPFITDWRDKVNRYFEVTNAEYDDNTLSSLLKGFMSRYPELCRIRDHEDQGTPISSSGIGFKMYYPCIV